MRLFGRRDTSRRVPAPDTVPPDLIWEDDEVVIDLRSEPTGDCKNCGGTMRVDLDDPIAGLQVRTCPQCGFTFTTRSRPG
ncbi:MAG: hypothetical protein MUF83_10760 [Acidimicrobiales bacterium]|nr:hypothetical protein [Acidimicrobiales bacterium]